MQEIDYAIVAEDQQHLLLRVFDLQHFSAVQGRLLFYQGKVGYAVGLDCMGLFVGYLECLLDGSEQITLILPPIVILI